MCHKSDCNVQSLRSCSLTIYSKFPSSHILDVWPAAGRLLTAEALAATLPGAGDEIAVAAAAQQLANELRRCKAGCGAVSALRVLALLQERLGADSQVGAPRV